ncbi:MAG: glycosyltransferase [Actinobacteria bacterium]|nr:glycosyltransferase [Actinomycetota bacterium]
MSPASCETSPLRVGYVLKKYPRLSETFILDEILGLEAAAVDVSVFSLRPPDDGHFHAQLALVRARANYLPAFGGASTMDALQLVPALPGGAERLGRVLAFVGSLPAERRPGLLVQGLHLARLVAEHRLDHLHGHFMTVAAHTAYVAHLLTDVPFTVTAHAKDIYRSGVDLRVFREVASAAKALVTVCEANRRYICDTILGAQAAQSRVVRVYNGVPVGELPTGSDDRDPGLLVAVGRLVEKKGFHVLLQACRLLVDSGIEFRCVLIGDGEEREALAALRSRLALEAHVELAGAMPRDEVLNWMRRARLLVAPCVTARDGNRDALPTVLLEALALGLPVVASAVGGVAEIVEDGSEGLLVEEGDAQALASAVGRLLTDDSLCRRLAAAGRAKALERFDRAQTIPHLVQVLSENPDRLAVAVPA